MSKQVFGFREKVGWFWQKDKRFRIIMMVRLVILFLLTLSPMSFMAGQDASPTIDQIAEQKVNQNTNQKANQEINGVSVEAYETLAKEINYDKMRNKLVPRNDNKKKKKKEKDKEKSKKSNLDFLKGIGSIFDGISYLLIAVLIGLVIYLIFANVKIERKVEMEEEEELVALPEHIDDIDVDDEYVTAIKNEDYRLAVRMQFIKVLQQLSNKNHIDWKFDKTNRDYGFELMGTKFHPVFRKLSYAFEWVWYGNKKIDKVVFDEINSSFIEFFELEL